MFHSNGRLLAEKVGIRLARDEHSSLFVHGFSIGEKWCYDFDNVIKLFMDVSHDFSKQARALVLAKPFQAILMFVGKAGAYLSEEPFRCCSTLG